MAQRSVAVAMTMIMLAVACGDDGDSGAGSEGGDAEATELQNGRSTEIADLRSVGDGGEQRPRVVAQDNRFVPENVRVDVGARVRWRNEGNNDHNIIAARTGVNALDDEGNEFGVLQGEFQPGDTYEFTFSDAGVYEYYCSLHGTPDQGMVGTVVVGDADYVPEIAMEPVERLEGTLRVPQDFDTIQDAVDHAAQGALVLVGEGVYHEAVVVNSPNIVIRGMDRNETILDGEFALANGIHVFVDGVAVENMTARNYLVNGFFWDGVTGYRGSYLTTHNVANYGIYAFGSVKGQFEHSYASGSNDGGFYIGQCNPCDAVITDVTSENNLLGYSGTNASDVVIVRSTFTSNRIGMVPNSWDAEDLAPVERNVFVGNLVVANNNTETPTANEFYELLYYSGIELGGTVDSLVLRNLVMDHDWAGIVVNAFPKTGELDGDFYPATGNEIRENVVMGSGRADLAAALVNDEDGNCWAENVYETSIPDDLEMLQPCEGPRSDQLDPGPLLAETLARDEPEGGESRDMPVAPILDGMPGDPATEPAIPATPDVVPMVVDIDAIEVPDVPEDVVPADL